MKQCLDRLKVDPRDSKQRLKPTNPSQQQLLPGDGSTADELPKERQFRRWASFRKALEASWSKSEIDELASTLRDFRGEIEFLILIAFRYVSIGIFEFLF